ncbi:ATP/GTP-binding protein [Kineococcus sp. SYSU DK003]|uniref:ATP/GTP-binding protein n=1 Tax=Kineococcus sp. SYSU DK003 TaxID=3383124 RepID=UPI003D7DE227
MNRPAPSPDEPTDDPRFLPGGRCYQQAICFALPGEPPITVEVVDPDALAQQAVSQLDIAPPDIQMVPDLAPGGFGFIGLPVWLWTPQPQWEPISASASAGGLTVTATAQLSSVDYDMGDGTTLHCTTPGEPYQESYGDRDSPTCGHRYQQTSVHEPGMAYTVTATAAYDVTWTGAATGATTLTDDATTQLPMGERQVLITS